MFVFGTFSESFELAVSYNGTSVPLRFKRNDSCWIVETPSGELGILPADFVEVRPEPEEARAYGSDVKRFVDGWGYDRYHLRVESGELLEKLGLIRFGRLTKDAFPAPTPVAKPAPSPWWRRLLVSAS